VDGLRPDLSCLSQLPQSLLELIVRCWDMNANNRPAFPEIVECLDDIQQLHRQTMRTFDDYVRATNEMRNSRGERGYKSSPLLTIHQSHSHADYKTSMQNLENMAEVIAITQYNVNTNTNTNMNTNNNSNSNNNHNSSNINTNTNGNMNHNPNHQMFNVGRRSYLRNTDMDSADDENIMALFANMNYNNNIHNNDNNQNHNQFEHKQESDDYNNHRNKRNSISNPNPNSNYNLNVFSSGQPKHARDDSALVMELKAFKPSKRRPRKPLPSAPPQKALPQIEHGLVKINNVDVKIPDKPLPQPGFN
jgi:hypothetical protein